MSNLPPGFVLDAPVPQSGSGGPVYGPPPKAPAQRDPLQVRRDELAIQQAEQDLTQGNDPPSGYRFMPDGSLQAIPGGPADKSPTADPQMSAEAIAKLSKVLTQIDQLYADSSDNGGWGETGWIGSQLRDTGGTAAYDLGQQVQTVEANAAFDALQRMREASPTGGALGQITERELDLLKSSVANINPNQSQDEFIRSLGIAKGVYLDQLRRLNPALADEIEHRGNPVMGANGVITYDQRQRDALAADAAPPASGGDAPQPPQPPGGGGSGQGLLSQLATSIQSDVAGAAQGAAGVYDLPMEMGRGVSRGVDYALGHGGGALVDLLGFPGAGDAMRRASDQSSASLAAYPTAAGTIENLSPTPEGMGGSRLLSQLVGGAMVPIGPKGAPRVAAPVAARAAPAAGREVVDAGRQAGVRVMTSDVRPPRTFIGKAARAMGERIPIAGTGGPRAAQQGERVQAVKDLARDFGADVADEYLEEVANDLSRTRGAKLTALAGQKNGVIDSIAGRLAPANVARTLEAIDAQVRRLTGIDATEYAPVIDRLTRFGANIASGKTLRQVEENRRLLGAMFEDSSLASLKTEGQKAVNAIYNPLREDMGEFIGANAGNAARTKWARANEELSAMAGELNDSVFRSVLRDAETTPENVAKILFGTKPSQVRRLVASLSPDGRARAQAAIIQRAIEKAGDEISPDKFANEIGRLGRSVGVVFEGADLARIQGLERLLQATKQAGVASAAPPNGVQTVPLLMGAGVGSTGGTAAIPLAIYGGLARLYESPAIRNLLLGLGKSPPGSQAEGQLLQRILKAATSQASIHGDAANDAFAASPGQLAAREQEQN